MGDGAKSLHKVKVNYINCSPLVHIHFIIKGDQVGETKRNAGYSLLCPHMCPRRITWAVVKLTSQWFPFGFFSR